MSRFGTYAIWQRKPGAKPAFQDQRKTPAKATNREAKRGGAKSNIGCVTQAPALPWQKTNGRIRETRQEPGQREEKGPS